MASISQDTMVRPVNPITGRNGLVDRYFYFAMALLFPVIVISGFSRTVGQNLFSAAIPRPTILWVHAAAFSAWVLVYFCQSALIRTHNVKWHRFFGWFGASLGAVMIPLGLATSVAMGRFNAVQLHRPDPTFQSVPFWDMTAFSSCLILAIYWRRKPELHRRLLFIGSCCLMAAPFARFVTEYGLFYPCLDVVILLGVVRDLLVNRRVHTVYRYGLPLVIAGQSVAVYLWIGAPSWWMNLSKAILGMS
jgi:hypothetical protein